MAEGDTLRILVGGDGSLPPGLLVAGCYQELKAGIRVRVPAGAIKIVDKETIPKGGLNDGRIAKLLLRDNPTGGIETVLTSPTKS